MPLPLRLFVCAQDVNSRSRLVRLYYSNRIFMGFCCVCCEVLYLALFLLHLPAYQTWGLMDVRVSQRRASRVRLRWWLFGGCRPTVLAGPPGLVWQAFLVH